MEAARNSLQSRAFEAWAGRPGPTRTGELLLATFLAILTLYGIYSIPGLWERWGGPSLASLAIIALWLGMACLARPLLFAPPSRKTLLVLTAVALIARCLVAIPFLGRTEGGDALFYPLLAWSIMHGHGLQVVEPFIGDTVRALFPPVFPLLLAGWGRFFDLTPTSLSILNLLIDGAAALLIFRLGNRVGAGGAGRAAAWLYIIWPSVLLSAPVAQKEGLVSLLVLALVHAWLDAAERPTARRIAAVGLVTALLALTQPALAPLSAVLGFFLLARDLRVLFRIAIGAIGVAALLATPWWLRNWELFHRFVPLTTSSGASLWIGNNPDSTGDWIPEPRTLRGTPELAYSNAAASMAWEWIKQNPYGFIRLTAEKLVRAMATGQAEVARLRDAVPHPPPSIGQAMFPVAQMTHLLLLGGSASALWQSQASWRLLIATILAACVAQILLFDIWFEFAERHREFLTPLLLLLLSSSVMPTLKRPAAPT
jgi:hypothetical protein